MIRTGYWDRISYQNKFGQIDIPTMHISGWYDDEQIGTFINYVGMRKLSVSRKSRENQVIVIGPWGHAVNSSRKLGEIDFGSEALIDLDSFEADWFRRWLTDEEVKTGRRARIFMMGKNEWFSFNDWPPSVARSSRLYLSSRGGAQGSRGGGDLVDKVNKIYHGEDRYFYDPRNPTPYVTAITSAQIGGPDDYSSVEMRDDVLVYSTPPLQKEVSFLGQVEANVFIKTDVFDTDIMAMLLDVWPNGYVQHLCDGMTRGRYRNGMDKVELLEKNKVYEIRVNMWNTGHTFQEGHKIRLQLSSSAFPKYSRNLNTGKDLANDSSTRVANVRILHSRDYPSSFSFRRFH